MYASLNYIHTRHPYGEIQGQPSQAPQSAAGSGLTNGDGVAAGLAAQSPAHNQSIQPSGSSPLTDSPDVFHAALRELAQDLILKEQQIEYLINSLPGLGSSEADQERRMRELEAELRQVEAERGRKERERATMVNLLGEVIGKVKRVP